MLVKIGSLIINLDSLLFVDLFHEDDYAKEIGVSIHFGDTTRRFWGEDAELLRWYLNHPTSKVIDLKNLKG
jgi:hypothetical protein